MKPILYYIQRALAAAALLALLSLLVLNAARVLRPRLDRGQRPGQARRPLGAFSFRTSLRSPRPVSVSIRNRSSNTLHDVWLWNAAEPNFFSTSTIAQSTLGPDMDEEEAATRLWQLVYRNSYHYWPATLGLELHDPAIFFAAYGYGMCDDRAEVLATLACAAGLPARTVGFQARVPGQPREVGHVLAEIFCGGRWRMFDPDCGVVFRREGQVLSLREARQELKHGPLTPQGGTWTAECVQALVRDTSVDQLHYPHRPERPDVEPGREMGLRLRPSERVVFEFDRRVQCHAMVAPPPWHTGGAAPPRFANGTIRHRVCFDDASAAIAADAVRTSGQAISLVHGARSGHVLYDLRFPFPLVDAECQFELAGPQAWVESYVTTHQRLKLFSDEPRLRQSHRWWRKLETVSGPGRHRISLRPFFRIREEMPTRYGYVLKLQVRSAHGQCRLSDLEVTSMFQFAPANMFRLHAGANTIRHFGGFSMRASPERLGSDGIAEVRVESEPLAAVIRYREAE